MKKYNYILVFSLAAILMSCESTLLRMGGLRKPDVESKATVLSFLSKIDVDTSDVYCIDSALFQQMKHLPFKPGWQPGFRPVQIRCYANDGRPVMQWASCEGFLKDLKTFDSVPPKNANGLDTTFNLGSDLSQYYTLDGKPANISPEPGYDLYFLVFFAKYFPRLTKESFRQLENYSRSHPELRMKIYKINVDVLDFWGDSLKVNLEMH